MKTGQTLSNNIPGKSELDAVDAVRVIVKLTQTHDAYISLYPELRHLSSAVVGEITVDEPEVEDLLLLRLLNIIHCLNENAEQSEVYKIVRKNFKSDLYANIDKSLPKYEGEFYL